MLELLLQAVASFGTDVKLSCAVASIAGLLAHHLYFIRGNHTAQARDIIAFHLVGFVLLLYRTTSASGLAHGLPVCFAISSSYLVTLFSSITAYRVLFHPLRHIPGPFPLRATQLYMTWLGRDGKFHKTFAAFHDTFGDFVRVGESLSIAQEEDVSTCMLTWGRP